MDAATYGWSLSTPRKITKLLKRWPRECIFKCIFKPLMITLLTCALVSICRLFLFRAVLRYFLAVLCLTPLYTFFSPPDHPKNQMQILRMVNSYGKFKYILYLVGQLYQETGLKLFTGWCRDWLHTKSNFLGLASKFFTFE